MRPTLPKISLWIGIILLVVFIVVTGKAFWYSYWLTEDPKQALALITEEHDHGTVSYKYTVNHHEYAGLSQRNWEKPEYRNVHAGEQSIMYFSASHPWISSLETPVFPPRALLAYVMFLGVLAAWVILAWPRSARLFPTNGPAFWEPRLSWYQHVWVALPLLLIFGGVIGGACGGAGWAINKYVFRRTAHPVLRYVWTGLITITAIGVLVAFVAVALHRNKGQF